MTDLKVLWENLLNGAREALSNIPDHPGHEFQAEAAILIAETSNLLRDWSAARVLVNELTELDAKAEKLQDIAKITQYPSDRVLAMQAAEEGGWTLDEDFSPTNISFERSAIITGFELISLAEVQRDGREQADLVQSYVSQLVGKGELEQAVEATKLIVPDQDEADIRENHYWCGSMQAIAVGYAVLSDFDQAVALLEQTSYQEYGYIKTSMEVACLVADKIKEGRPSG